jgi:hypothetical protein
MNLTERRMLELLIKGKAEFGIDSVKAEFEAEGTRSDEFLRLLEIARRAGLKVGLKIGGCEAVRDLIEARQYGADYIIAPMIETPYALKKYIEAKDKVYPKAEQADIGFLFNVETRSTLDHVIEMGQAAKIGGVGMVFGRVDFAGSMGHTRDFVNSDEMMGYVEKVSMVTSLQGIDLVVGGGVSPDSIEPLRRIRQTRLNRFETRKVIFDAAVLDGDKTRDGMELAIEFELLWLQNKRDYYQAIASEDEKRIGMMEARQNGKVAIAA